MMTEHTNGRGDLGPEENPVNKVLSRLEGVRKTKKGHEALCPAHDDHKPSLSVDAADDGRVLLHCFAGCKTIDVCEAMGLKLRDLFPKKWRPRPGDKDITRTDAIKDHFGKIQAYHVRFDYANGEKECLWQHPDGTYGLKGRRVETLPLYGSELSTKWAPGTSVILVEGEPAADAIRAAGLEAVGTVTGAGNGSASSTKTPNREALEVLRDMRVYIWPDNDPQGRAHMNGVAQNLQGIAREIRWFEWEGAPEKGDAADHPVITGGDLPELAEFRKELTSAPIWTPGGSSEATDTPANPLIAGLVSLADALEHGIEPPEELESGILLKGMAHHIYAPAAVGKTFLAIWLALQSVGRGEKVLYIDEENGPYIFSDRLEVMGAPPEALREHFHYLPSPALGVSTDTLENYRDLLETLKPDLVVFDSLIKFLASAGFEENANDDIAAWAEAFIRPARVAGITTMVLDHVPHDGDRSRGASRKMDEFDIQHRLVKAEPFDRETVGEIKLQLKKDRLGWLPQTTTFSIGGSEEATDGFVFFRSAGTVTIKGPGDVVLEGKTKTVFEVLRSEFGTEGARHSEWLKEARKKNVGKSTFNRSIEDLIRSQKVERRDVPNGTKYYPTDQDTSPTDDGTKFTARESQKPKMVPQVPQVPKWSHGTDETGLVPQVPHPLRGGTMGPTHEPTVENALELLERRDPQTLLEQWRNSPTEDLSKRFASLVACVAKEAGHGANWRGWCGVVADAVEKLEE